MLLKDLNIPKDKIELFPSTIGCDQMHIIPCKDTH